MKTIKIECEFIYDDKIMHGENKEDIDWFFNDILSRDILILYSNEIGDKIGEIRNLKILGEETK